MKYLNLYSRMFLPKNYYHVINRGVEKRITFIDDHDYKRFITTLSYYKNSNPPLRLSEYLRSTGERKELIDSQLCKANDVLVKIIAYCIMPNHFHFLITPTSEGSLSEFMKRITDSYTLYFNKRYTRIGPLFQGVFKSVPMTETDQFLHVSRYIHLNPYTSHVISHVEELSQYPWSSLHLYKKNDTSFIDSAPILSRFPKSNYTSYEQFLYDQAEYQRKIKHT